MQQPEGVGCVTLLTMAKVYLYRGTFYRYLYSSDSIRYTQYYFRPLKGQRKTADIKLNRDKVLRTMQYIPGMSITAVIHQNYVQLSLF
jgi:hypothetical protein